MVRWTTNSAWFIKSISRRCGHVIVIQNWEIIPSSRVNENMWLLCMDPMNGGKSHLHLKATAANYLDNIQELSNSLGKVAKSFSSCLNWVLYRLHFVYQMTTKAFVNRYLESLWTIEVVPQGCIVLHSDLKQLFSVVWKWP